MSKSVTDHKTTAPTRLKFAILTVSTSRYQRMRAGIKVENPSGEIIARLLEEDGHEIAYDEIISDDRRLIRETLERIVKMPEVESVITCGGTGITKTDITVETVDSMLDKEMPGFGELFRKLSYDEIGSAVIITRAEAGLINGKPIFCLPGSPQAVELALKKLILPEVGHIVKHARE